MSRIANEVGVIIPVYNRPRLVLKTLDSVAKQTVLPGKLVIVDDGSTDNTAMAVQQWIDNLQIPLKADLISATENRGVAAVNSRTRSRRRHLRPIEAQLEDLRGKTL